MCVPTVSPANIGVSSKFFILLASLSPRKFELSAQALHDAELLGAEISQIRKDLQTRKRETVPVY